MKQGTVNFKNLIFPKKTSLRDKICSALFLFLVAVFVILIAFSKVYIADKIKGESMCPTFSDGDIVYYSQTHEITYGDIVIISTSDKDIIKRVIGLSGDTIEIKEDVTGYYYVYRNGERLHEPYINGIEGNTKKYNEFKTFQGKSVVVGENEFFVLGDNRANSSDSAQYGCFSYNQLQGKVEYTVKAGRVPSLDIFRQLFLPIFK